MRTMDGWQKLMQVAAVTGTVAAMIFALAMTLLGLGFVPRGEFDALRRMVRFNSCALVLEVGVCQEAHGITREELLREVD